MDIVSFELQYVLDGDKKYSWQLH